MGANYKKCNWKTHYRVRRGIIVKYSTCARAMWRRRGGGRSAGRRELGAVGAGRGGARRRCGWRLSGLAAVLPWRAVRSGVWGLDFGRRGCPGAASRTVSGAGGQAVRLGSRLHLGRCAGQWIAGNSGAAAAGQLVRRGRLNPARGQAVRRALAGRAGRLSGHVCISGLQSVRRCAWRGSARLSGAYSGRGSTVCSWRAGVNTSVARLNGS